MANHGNTERHILSLFEKNKTFSFENINYSIVKIGKPRPARGECKTDIYILAIDALFNKKEFKISIKQKDADFLENKMSIDRAKEIFGEDASQLIKESVQNIKEAFSKDFLINLSKYKRTEANCIKIGWKFELLNKLGGEKSGLVELNEEQKIDVYAGSNLSIEKRNAKVNNEVIENSGIANYIMEIDIIKNDLDFYLNRMLDIKEFAREQCIYFACKAVNYRVDHDKWDGDRPLSVYCKWFITEDNKLDVEILYDTPLEIKANIVGNNIRSILKQIGLNKDNFSEIQHLISNNVKLYN